MTKKSTSKYGGVKELFAAKGASGTLIDYLWLFIKQFSPKDNEITPTHANYIAHYVKTAVESSDASGKKSNILELGSNHGILSCALHTMGHSVLCTDIHHGMLTASLESYKVGTWIREHFIGLSSIDCFVYPADGAYYLDVFENGLDAIVMRGTGILGIEGPVEHIPMRKKVLNKIFNKPHGISSQYQAVLRNCSTLLQGLNPGGLLYAAQENLFWNMPPKERISTMKDLMRDLKDLGSG